MQWKISRWTVLITLFISLIAGAISGSMSFFEARKVQDEMLGHISQLLPQGNFGKANIDKELDDDTQIFVRNITNNTETSFHNIAENKDGFYSMNYKDDHWRILITTVKSKNQTIRYLIAQETEVRNEIALMSFLSAVIPSLITAIAILILFNYFVYQQLKPIRELGHSIDNRDEYSFKSIPVEKIPSEISPFVQAINRLLSRNEKTMLRQQRFIADAAHELRTPVTSLSITSDSMKKAHNVEDLKAFHNVLDSGLQRLKNLIEQLLSLAKLQNNYQPQHSVSQLDDIVKSAVSTLFPLADEKNIDLGVIKIMPAKLNDIDFSLQHIVNNAITNAIRYTPNDGTIDICLEVKNNRAIFSVKDSGPGIDDEDLKLIYEPFYRSSENTEHGNGLGLSIAFEASRRLHGNIEIKNHPDGGALFTYQQTIV